MNRQTNAAAVTAWFSQVLQDPSLQQLDQLKTGVHFVQIVHSIDPTKFDLSRCDFRASSPYHYEKNFKLLQEAMDRMGIAISFVIERVMEGVKQNDLLRLASYFQLHFDAMRSASVREKERGGTTVTSVHGVRTREKPKRNPDSLEAHQRVVKMVDPASPVVTGSASGGGGAAAWSSPSEGPAASRSPVETAADEQPDDDGNSPSPSAAAVVVTTKLSRAEELRLLQEQYNPVLERSQAIERRRRRMRPRVNQAALEAASVRTGTTSNVSSSTNRTTTSCSLSYVDGQLSVLYRNSKRCVPLLSSAAMEERNNAATAAVAGATTASSAAALPELVPLPGGVPLLGGADTPTGDQRITRWAMQVATSQAEQDGSFRGTSPTMSTSPTPDGTAAGGARRSSSSLPNNNNTPLQQQPYLAGSFPATTMADSESSSVMFGATPMTTAHATAQPYIARPGAASHPLLNNHASSAAVGSGAAANVLEMFGDAMLSSAVVSASLVGFSPWNLVRVAAKQQLQQQRDLATTSVCPAENSNDDDGALDNRRHHQDCATTTIATTTETDASVLKTEFSVSGFTNTTNSATASMKSSNSIHCPSSPSLLLNEVNSPETRKIRGTSIHDDCIKNDVQTYTQTLFRTVWAPSVIDVEGDRTAQQHYISYEEILAEKTKLLHQMVQRHLQLNHPSSVSSSHAKHPHSAAAHHASGGRRPSGGVAGGGGGGGFSPVPGGQGGPAPILSPPPPLDRLLAAHPSHPNQNGPHIGQLHSDMSSGNLSPRSTATPGSAQQLSGTVFLSPMTRTHSALSMLYSREGTTSPLVLVPDATSGSWSSATAAGVAAAGGGGNGAAGGGNEGGVPLSALSWNWIDKETFRVDAWDDFDRAMGWLE